MANLIEYDKPFLFAGTVLRFVGEYPFHGKPVHFMICDYHAQDTDRCPFALYCVSGYHAGSLEYVFPKEAMAENVKGIKTEWLKDNWNSKVYDGCPIENVEVIEEWQE